MLEVWQNDSYSLYKSEVTPALRPNAGRLQTTKTNVESGFSPTLKVMVEDPRQ
ncbi:MAG: hypothetical protein ACJ75J_17385 [Cytophagaceae bacterium]